MTGLIGRNETCRRSGVSYRQLDMWVRNGVITPAERGHGSGSRTRWTPLQVSQLATLTLIQDYAAGYGFTAQGLNHETVRQIWNALVDGQPWSFCLHITADGRLLVGEAAA